MTTKNSPPGQHHDLRECIEVCTHCHQVCEQMIFQHCLKVGGKHAEAAHLTLMADCAQICALSADFMTRGSPRHALTCRLCAEICTACAEDCQRIGDMAECVEACRHCAETCRAMAA